jgi:SAM-dependent methyltransferase
MGFRLPDRVALKEVSAILGLRSDVRGQTRLNFLSAAALSGLIEALDRPGDLGTIANRMGGSLSDDLLEALLRVGVAVGELGHRENRFSMKGRRIRAMSDRDSALRAMAVEVADYHGSVYRELPGRLRGRPLGSYLPQYDEVIARSSRLVEPFVAPFVRRVVSRSLPGRLLEIGCGSGVYLRHAATASPSLTGIGIDISDRVVAIAKANLNSWGIDDRFEVIAADIHSLTGNADSFGLITLYNNIYYFSPTTRPSLLEDIRRRIEPGGRLVVVSFFQGNSFTSADLDLALRSTEGCWRLPDRTELRQNLISAGFRAVSFSALMPSEPLFGVVATV